MPRLHPRPRRRVPAIVLQGFKLSIPVGGHAAQLGAGFDARAAKAHEIAAPQGA